MQSHTVKPWDRPQVRVNAQSSSIRRATSRPRYLTNSLGRSSIYDRGWVPGLWHRSVLIGKSLAKFVPIFATARTEMWVWWGEWEFLQEPPFAKVSPGGMWKEISGRRFSNPPRANNPANPWLNPLKTKVKPESLRCGHVDFRVSKEVNY